VSLPLTLTPTLPRALTPDQVPGLSPSKPPPSLGKGGEAEAGADKEQALATLRQLQLLQPSPGSSRGSFLSMDSLSLPKWLTSPSLSLPQFSATPSPSPKQDGPPPPPAEKLNGKVLAFSDV